MVEPTASKRALATKFGATAAFAPEHLPELTVDTTFDCVAAASTLGAAGAATVPGGTVVVVGVPSGDTALPLARLQRWEIDVRGTGLYVGADIDAVLQLLATTDSGIAALVTAEYPVTEAAAAFAATADPDQVKVTVTWPS
ncbi:MAG: zinc-binding dehydrogenase [Streptosporangiales bacterium]|nr:zinc-binding dehydrogenase [Streptosporangiales bacterium]